MPFKDKQKAKEYFKKRYIDNIETLKIQMKQNHLKTYPQRREQIAKSNKEWAKKNHDKKAEIQRRYSQRNPQKIKAQQKAHKIPLKNSCEICQSKSNLQRHHWRYDKPLLVNTLCSPCHSIQHSSRRLY